MFKIAAVFLSQLIFFTIILFLAPALFIRQRVYDLHEEAAVQLPLSPSSTYSRPIDVTTPNLNSISFFLKNPNLKNQQTLVLSVFNQSGVIRQSTFSGRNVGDPSWLTYKFDPISGSPSHLTVEISSLGQSVDSLYLLANKSGQPVYRLTHKSADLRQSLNQSAANQIAKLGSLSRSFVAFYFIILIIADFFLFVPINIKPQNKAVNRLKQPE